MALMVARASRMRSPSMIASCSMVTCSPRLGSAPSMSKGYFAQTTRTIGAFVKPEMKAVIVAAANALEFLVTGCLTKRGIDRGQFADVAISQKLRRRERELGFHRQPQLKEFVHPFDPERRDDPSAMCRDVNIAFCLQELHRLPHRSDINIKSLGDLGLLELLTPS